MRDKIKVATNYVNRHRDEIAKSQYRQNFHFCSPVGWMNDPNGFIFYQGKYHLFFQYHPFDATWHTMYWGHIKSSNLIDWEILPIALAPDESYDDDENGGCFSGTAIEQDGKLLLFYTGSVTGKDGEFIQTQCLASSEDGLTFEKHHNNPLVVVDYPNVSEKDFRDPKVWFKSGVYYMLVGVCIDGKGNALLYRSNNSLDWSLIGPTMDTKRDDLGAMWECPDYFELGGKSILIFSPLGLGDCLTMYLIGTLDYETGTFLVEKQERVDYGTDFYAPQSLLDNQGKRIMIGWQNGWDWMPKWNGFGPTAEDKWCGSMSLPREVVLNKAGLLSFLPTRYLDEKWKNRLTKKGVKLNERLRTIFSQIDESFQIEVVIPVKELKYEIEIVNGHDEKDLIIISQAEIVYSSVNNKYGKCNVSLPIVTDEINLTIISDTTSLEIFEKNSGKVMSINNYLTKGKRTVKMCCSEEKTLAIVNLYEF